MTVTPDPRPAARIVASRSEWADIAREKAGPCRVCGSLSNIELHHLVSRAQRGDDVADNLIPLCSEHHRLVTHRDHATMHSLRAVLLPEEAAYCAARKSWAWLDDTYPFGGEVLCARCKRPVQKPQEPRSEPRKRKRYVVTVPDDHEDGADILDALVEAHRRRLKPTFEWQDDVPAYFVLAAVLVEALNP